jgi:hypothetical protein
LVVFDGLGTGASEVTDDGGLFDDIDLLLGFEDDLAFEVGNGQAEDF